jgi:quercetin dioxygenase-like cupin family protein
MSPLHLPSVEASLAAVAKGEPLYQRWQDYRRSFSWSNAANGGAESGSRFVQYPAIEGPLVSGRVLMLPAAQSFGPRSHDTDTVYLGLEGETEFTVGEATYLVKPLDMLCIPAGSSYRCTNSDLANAVLGGIYAKHDASQPKSPASAKPGAAPTHMVWERYRRDFHWTLPWAERWGYHRGSGPLIMADGLRGHTVRIPPGQSTPWHFAPRDLVFMGIQNEVEFKAAGREFPLTRYDLLIVPGGTPYRYTNYGLTECVFLSIGGKLPPGKKGIYFTSDPGWPIRADAERISVEIDPYGDARVIAEKTAAAGR